MGKYKMAKLALAACVLGFIIPAVVYGLASAFLTLAPSTIGQWGLLLFLAFEIAALILGIAAWQQRDAKIAVIVPLIFIVGFGFSALIPQGSRKSQGVPRQEIGNASSLSSTLSIAIKSKFRGVASINFDPLTNRESNRTPMVIKDQKNYHQFISLIPKQQIGKRNPMPVSTDPLLKKPAIDFTKEMMLVVFRHGTIAIPPEIVSIHKQGAKMIVNIAHPPLGNSQLSSRPHGIGTYCAVIISKFAGKIIFRTKL